MADPGKNSQETCRAVTSLSRSASNTGELVRNTEFRIYPRCTESENLLPPPPLLFTFLKIYFREGEKHRLAAPMRTGIEPTTWLYALTGNPWDGTQLSQGSNLSFIRPFRHSGEH